MDWHLECSDCGATESAQGLKSVCPTCGRPWLVRYPGRKHGSIERGADPVGMWRNRSFLPLLPGEEPVSLGEGGTPLLPAGRLAGMTGLAGLLIKDESSNPTGSFKSRGMSAAVTRAVAAGAEAFVLPTAGNAGVAASAYGARAGVPVRVYAPSTTPVTILSQIRSFGGDLVLLDGHIGDCGREARAFAASEGAFDLSTLREPYRIEGKKTLALEIAEQLGWTMPDAIVYPTGGGTGLIGMWKGFRELRDAGWVNGRLPRMYSVQSEGCAPIVRAFNEGAARAVPWQEPETIASGLRVPGALGDALILQAVRESGGGAIAVSDELLQRTAQQATRISGIDFCPEGGAALAGAIRLRETGQIGAEECVVVCNTGAGWLYRNPG
jgi:threonine synthase